MKKILGSFVCIFVFLISISVFCFNFKLSTFLQNREVQFLSSWSGYDQQKEFEIKVTQLVRMALDGDINGCISSRNDLIKNGIFINHDRCYSKTQNDMKIVNLFRFSITTLAFSLEDISYLIKKWSLQSMEELHSFSGVHAKSAYDRLIKDMKNCQAGYCSEMKNTPYSFFKELDNEERQIVINFLHNLARMFAIWYQYSDLLSSMNIQPPSRFISFEKTYLSKMSMYKYYVCKLIEDLSVLVAGPFSNQGILK